MRKSSEPHDAAASTRREPPKNRRAYGKPRLTEYGNLRELALVKGGVKNDGHSGEPSSRV